MKKGADQLQRRDYTVVVHQAPNTGVIVWECWTRSDGKLERLDGPACIYRDAETGVVTRETWYMDGKLHRVDGPAVIKRKADTGSVSREEYYTEGRFVRDRYHRSSPHKNLSSRPPSPS